MKVQDLLIKDIRVVENHRNKVEDDSIAELMQSIKQHGLKQPIGVVKNALNKYDLIFGHRRMFACLKLGHNTIRAQVEESCDLRNILILNITENLQRKDPSWAEYGRVIEKLQKTGLTTKEISVRLGIDEKKVDGILGTYKKLPEKYRKKVQFMNKGERKEGAIPAQVATQLINIKKNYGLTDKNLDELVDYVGKGDVGRETLKNLNILLKTGIEFKDALEKMFDYEVYRIDLVAHRLEVGKKLAEHQLSSAQLLFKRVLYGQIPGIKKPDFIKV